MAALSSLTGLTGLCLSAVRIDRSSEGNEDSLLSESDSAQVDSLAILLGGLTGRAAWLLMSLTATCTLFI